MGWVQGQVCLLHSCLGEMMAMVAVEAVCFYLVLLFSWDPMPRILPGLGLYWGINQEQGSSPLCSSLALGGHGEVNTTSQPLQHVETINNLM